jgi:hypothetical protein
MECIPPWDGPKESIRILSGPAIQCVIGTLYNGSGRPASHEYGEGYAM